MPIARVMLLEFLTRMALKT